MSTAKKKPTTPPTGSVMSGPGIEFVEAARTQLDAILCNVEDLRGIADDATLNGNDFDVVVERIREARKALRCALDNETVKHEH